MKKRIVSIVMVMLLCVSVLGLAGCGKKKAETVKTYVTLTDAGNIAGAYKEVEVEDADSDGVISISDAISCAHKVMDSKDGYAAETGDYGLSITKLLGVENGGSYGVYVNNAYVSSLADAVKEGDYVYAYSYKDLTAWTDAYSYFDKETAKASELTLTLNYIAFDAEYTPVVTPAAGATITIDGNATEFVTAADGTVSITVEGSGEHIISATSDTMTLVPPVCVVTVG